MGMLWLSCAVLLALSPAWAGAQEVERYRAWLETPGGELPFGLEIDGEMAVLINGPERDDAPRVRRAGDRIIIDMPYFDSRLEAVERDGRLDGVWRKVRGGGEVFEVPFHARKGDAPRFHPMVFIREDPTPPFTGRWLAHFDSSDDPAVGLFQVAGDGTATGTFLTTTGDYRYLAGRQDGSRLRLSCFDGAHAFLFDAHADEDGELHGTFYSGNWWEEQWSATRAPDAGLPSGWAQTSWESLADLSSLRFPDRSGKEHAVSEYLGEHGLVIKVFGSWCPNCRDAASHMAELHDRYGERGVGFLGLAFELTGDLERDGRQVDTFAEHTGIDFPVLIAGLSDKGKASLSLPILDRVRSFPTTIFVGSDGRIRAVYTGYSGPATGAPHERLLEEFDEQIETLIDG